AASRKSYSVRWPSAMSQQGTPFGAITPLNQARMSAGTFSYCPLSKARAAPASADKHASRAIRVNLRMRSSTALYWHHRCGPVSRAAPRISRLNGLSPSCRADACSKNMRCATQRIDAVRNRRVRSHRALRRGRQQLLQLLLVEFRIAGGEMTARFGAGGDQIEPAVLDAFQ